MKCTKENVEKFCNALQNNLEGENGRGEFDDESDLLTACERVIEWIEEEKWEDLDIKKQEELIDDFFKERDLYPFEDDGKITDEFKRWLEDKGI